MRLSRARWMLWGCCALLALSGTGRAQDAAVAEDAEGVTVITSDKLTFDYQNKYALFERNVVVTDPQMKLTADKLVVEFVEGGKAELIVAEGNVVIHQLDKTAYSGKATYDVNSGKIVLVDEPKVERGRDVLVGDRITFFRDENKMICEPQARLVIFPEEGGSRDTLLGE